MSSPEVVFPADSADGLLSKQESGALRWWEEGEDEVRSGRLGEGGAGAGLGGFTLVRRVHSRSAAFH